MTIRLYVVPGSNPSMSARLMLEHKRLEYTRVDLIPTVHMAFLRAVGFPRPTVPALKLDGRRIQGSLAIPRALEEVRSEPRLFPDDPERRAAVEEAERWGEAVFQAIPRRLTWWALKRNRSAMASFAQGAQLHVPIGIAWRTAGPIVRWEIHTHEATDDAVRADLASLPALVDKIDGWIADGVLDSEQLNVADFQIAPSVRLLLCHDDLRSVIAQRPAGRFATRVVPDFPGRVPSSFPPSWLTSHG